MNIEELCPNVSVTDLRVEDESMPRTVKSQVAGTLALMLGIIGVLIGVVVSGTALLFIFLAVLGSMVGNQIPPPGWAQFRTLLIGIGVIAVGILLIIIGRRIRRTPRLDGDEAMTQNQ